MGCLIATPHSGVGRKSTLRGPGEADTQTSGLSPIPGLQPGLLKGLTAPPHQLGGLRERCKVAQWGPGRSPKRPEFLCILGSSLRVSCPAVLLCKTECSVYIQGGPKNLAPFFLYDLTLPNINRFSKLFHNQNQEKICNNTVANNPTTP